MQIGVIGINHKLADLALREQLALCCLKHFGNDYHALTQSIVLSTCNRTEVYFHAEDLAAAHTHILSILKQDSMQDFDQKLYSYFGEDCLLHLCRVTTGLDSAIIAETEVQGQVKIAYEKAATQQTLPKELHYLFQKSLKIAKEVRSYLPFDKTLPNLEHAIGRIGNYFFADTAKRVKILFVGASTINDKNLSFFSKKAYSDLTICNRTLSKSQGFADQYACQILPWEHLLNSWQNYDWIICGTKSFSPLPFAACPRLSLSKKQLIIDLGVPRNVHPDLAKQPFITLLNIDQLNRTLKFRRQRLQHLLIHAEALIKTAAQNQVRRYKVQQLSREQWLAAVI